jgi:hypothetical protein
MLSPLSPFICLSWATVMENCRAMLNNVSPGRTLYMRGAPLGALVLLEVEDGRFAAEVLTGRAGVAAGSPAVEGAGIASV